MLGLGIGLGVGLGIVVGLLCRWYSVSVLVCCVVGLVVVWLWC